MKSAYKTGLSFFNTVNSFFLFEAKNCEMGVNFGKAAYYRLKALTADSQKEEVENIQQATENFNKFKNNCSESYEKGQTLAASGLDVVTHGADTIANAAETCWHVGRASFNGLHTIGTGLVVATGTAANISSDLVSRAANIVVPMAKNAAPIIDSALLTILPSPVLPLYKVVSSLARYVENKDTVILPEIELSTLRSELKAAAPAA